jgi:hypothetical protein
MELKPCDHSTIERALGIIEGVATAFRYDERYEDEDFYDIECYKEEAE